jgi:hypothetical protein
MPNTKHFEPRTLVNEAWHLIRIWGGPFETRRYYKEYRTRADCPRH